MEGERGSHADTGPNNQDGATPVQPANIQQLFRPSRTTSTKKQVHHPAAASSITPLTLLGKSATANKRNGRESVLYHTPAGSTKHKGQKFIIKESLFNTPAPAKRAKHAAGAVAGLLTPSIPAPSSRAHSLHSLLHAPSTSTAPMLSSSHLIQRTPAGQGQGRDHTGLQDESEARVDERQGAVPPATASLLQRLLSEAVTPGGGSAPIARLFQDPRDRSPVAHNPTLSSRDRDARPANQADELVGGAHLTSRPAKQSTGQHQCLTGQDQQSTGQNQCLTGQDQQTTGPNKCLTSQNQQSTGQTTWLTGQNPGPVLSHVHRHQDDTGDIEYRQRQSKHGHTTDGDFTFPALGSHSSPIQRNIGKPLPIAPVQQLAAQGAISSTDTGLFNKAGMGLSVSHSKKTLQPQAVMGPAAASDPMPVQPQAVMDPAAASDPRPVQPQAVMSPAAASDPMPVQPQAVMGPAALITPRPIGLQGGPSPGGNDTTPATARVHSNARDLEPPTLDQVLGPNPRDHAVTPKCNHPLQLGVPTPGPSALFSHITPTPELRSSKKLRSPHGPTPARLNLAADAVADISDVMQGHRNMQQQLLSLLPAGRQPGLTGGGNIGMVGSKRGGVLGGGLSGRLGRILQREKEAGRQQGDPMHVLVESKQLEAHMLKCRCSAQDSPMSAMLIYMFIPVRSATDATIEAGSRLRIFPPWRMMQLDDSASVVLAQHVENMPE